MISFPKTILAAKEWPVVKETSYFELGYFPPNHPTVRDMVGSKEVCAYSVTITHDTVNHLYFLKVLFHISRNHIIKTGCYSPTLEAIEAAVTQETE